MGNQEHIKAIRAQIARHDRMSALYKELLELESESNLNEMPTPSASQQVEHRSPRPDIADMTVEEACVYLALQNDNAPTRADELTTALLEAGFQTKAPDRLSNRVNSALVQRSNLWQVSKRKVRHLMMNVYSLHDDAFKRLKNGESLDKVKSEYTTRRAGQ